MCSNWFLGGWMFVCCIWDEAWILNEVDCNLSFCLDLKVFFLNEVSSFLLFLCNDLISQLHRRGTILFSQIVMVKEAFARIEWDPPSRAQWVHVLICWSHSLPWQLWSGTTSSCQRNPMYSAVVSTSLLFVCLQFHQPGIMFFAGHLPSNSAVFQMTLWYYPV